MSVEVGETVADSSTPAAAEGPRRLRGARKATQEAANGSSLKELTIGGVQSSRRLRRRPQRRIHSESLTLISVSFYIQLYNNLRFVLDLSGITRQCDWENT